MGFTVEIGRTAFRLFGIDIYWYGVVISVAIVLGFLYATKRAPQFGLISDKVFDAAAAGLIGGFIGARTYYTVFYNLSPDNPNKYTLITAVTGIRDGGLAIYGGIIGAVTFALIYMKIKKIKLLPVLDLGGLGFLMGIGLGRWGNFFNQEAYGAVIKRAGGLPWGMTGSTIAEEVGWDNLVHPCFLYESIWCLAGFLLLHFYSRKFRMFDGEVFLLFAAWYGTGRSLNESLRTDSLMLGSFKISQLLAAVSALAAVVLFVYFKRKAPGNLEFKLYRDTDESKAALSGYEETLLLLKEKSEAKRVMKKEKTAPSILGDGGTDDGEV